MNRPFPEPPDAPAAWPAAEWRRLQLGAVLLGLAVGVGAVLLMLLAPTATGSAGKPVLADEPLRQLMRGGALVMVLLGVAAAAVMAPAARDLLDRARRLAARSAGRAQRAAVLDGTAHLVLIADTAHRVTWANAAATRHTGWESHEVEGRALTDLLGHPDVDPTGAERLAQALAAGAAARLRLPMRSRDGRECWLDVDLQPLHDDAGAMSGHAVVGVVVPEGPPDIGLADAEANKATEPPAALADLRAALQQAQLHLVYQPIVGLERRRLVAVEALVRWRHPQRGELLPGDFLPLARAHGLMDAIGDQVLHRACAAFADWHQRYGTQAPDRLVVNMATSQLIQVGAVPEVLAVLDAHGLQPQQLQLDVTAPAAEDEEALLAALRQLKAQGVRLALDDFGSGHSSMAALHRLPVDTVKIDRAFVAGAADIEHHRVLVAATVRVARGLGLCTVAEGVETEAQAELMATLGCERGQGWWFGRPLAADDMAELLSAREPSDTAA